MWVLILVVIAFIAIKFMLDMSKQSSQIASEGGMREKYRVLINHLMSGDPRSRVIREDRSAVLVGMSSAGGSTTFDVVQTFGKVIIKWNVKSPIFGNHSVEMSFPEEMDQDEMYERLEAKVASYQANMLDGMA